MKLPRWIAAQDPKIGTAAMVFRGKELLWEQTAGYSHRESREKVNAETNFNLASLSKQFTAFSIYLCHRRGALNLNDAIANFIPALPECIKPVTIKDLLFHTSGLPDYIPLAPPSVPVTNHIVCESLRRANGLRFEPGSRFEYSNTGYVLLSEIIQSVTGRRFPDFLENEIFNKVGMKHTFVFSPATENRVDSGAIGYTQWPFVRIRNRSRFDYVFGDGGIYSNLSDYRKWLESLVNGTWGTHAELGVLFQPVRATSGREFPYAYGWKTGRFNGRFAAYHTGSWLGFRNAAIYFRDSGIWSVLFSNSSAIDAVKLSVKNAARFLG